MGINTDYFVVECYQQYEDYENYESTTTSVDLNDLKSTNDLDELNKHKIEIYDKFKYDILLNIHDVKVMNGMYYNYEEVFDQYCKNDAALSILMLQALMTNYYNDSNIIIPILHLISHREYDKFGEYLVLNVVAFLLNKDKKIKKITLKVFDNWDSVNTWSVLENIEDIQESWLNLYKNNIILRLKEKMTFYIRAIHREYWPEPNELSDIKELDSDAFSDLNTKDNKLSFWCADDTNQIDEAIVAYLASMDKWMALDEAEFIAIDSSIIQPCNFIICNQPNFTYINAYKSKHVDFCDLNLDSLETLSKKIIDSLDKYFILKDQNEIKEMFLNVLKKGLLKSENISKENHGKFKKYIKQLEDSLEKKE